MRLKDLFVFFINDRIAIVSNCFSGFQSSGNLTPSPAAEVTMDLLGSSGGLSFPTASHSRASSATSLNSVAEEPMSNNGHNTRSNGHGSGNPPRINSPVSNNFESSQPNTAALARALKSTRSPSSISTSSSNNKSFTVTLPMSKLRELKVASLSPSGKRGSIGGRDLSSNDSQVDMLQFLRRLDSLCNRKKDNLTKKVLICSLILRTQSRGIGIKIVNGIDPEQHI